MILAPGTVLEVDASTLAAGPLATVASSVPPAAGPAAAATAPPSGGTAPAPAGPPADAPLTLEESQRRHILRALGECQWVIEGPKGAAKVLGLHPNTLRSRMKKLGIKR